MYRPAVLAARARAHDIRQWLLAKLPAGVLARPFEWLLAIGCVFSGVSGLIGATYSRSAEALLPAKLDYVWYAVLVVGGLAFVCGLSSYRRGPAVWLVTRVPCYKLGLRLCGISSGLYAIALLAANPSGSTPAAPWAIGFGAACLIRSLTLGEAR